LNVVAGETKSVNNAVTVRINQTLLQESFLTGNDIFYSAEAFSERDAKEEIEEYASEQRQIEEALVNSEFLNSAEAITAEGADQEIEKYATKQVSLQIARAEK
jgi:hypothetical protein